MNEKGRDNWEEQTEREHPGRQYVAKGERSLNKTTLSSSPAGSEEAANWKEANGFANGKGSGDLGAGSAEAEATLQWVKGWPEGKQKTVHREFAGKGAKKQENTETTGCKRRVRLLLALLVRLGKNPWEVILAISSSNYKVLRNILSYKLKCF